MRNLVYRRLLRADRGLVGLGLLGMAASAPVLASDVAPGDVFAGVAGGKYQRYSASGILLETLDTGYTGTTTGCAVDAALDLYVTIWDVNRLVKLAHTDPHPVLLDFATDGVVGAPDTLSESVVLDATAHILVGHAAGGRQLHRYDAAGVLVGEHSVAGENAGSDWIDLASDQCTLFYASEGVAIKRFDICTDSQLADFATLTQPGSWAAALRILPPGDGSGGLVVASLLDIKRMDGAGVVIATYDVPGEDGWFAMNLTPDGQSFWSAGNDSGNLYRFNLATGAVEVGPIASGVVTGICVAGEPTGALCPVLPEPVRGLLAVRRTADVALEWRAASDAATDHYAPWKVVNGDKLLIPVANRITALVNSSVVAACPAVPRLTPSCTDAGAVAPPPLLFYQVRGACSDGVEGTAHPF